ncbi:hypothetical protein ABD76_02065 [Paenibacillus dendritiformis]|uniref:PD40 domain-containing protein n=1 Tax=Paenibacillus dendritiformis TaxID=130049 RepID=UPI0018CC827D|nr:PD40 domain-containing protein [Paenibacillus dendritiformis]MBG9791371.1 hypothetical protein [Paenibacillus dendritiformis]
MKNRLIALIVFALLCSCLPAMSRAEPDAERKAAAAFIRGNDLWMAIGSEEKRLTRGEYIRNPHWSHDGSWLAFSKGKEEKEIWLYHAATGEMRQAGQGDNVQWSPSRNVLAFQSQDARRTLYVTDAEGKREPERIADHVGNFSWKPDGASLLYSVEARLLPDGIWSDIDLYTVRLDKEARSQLFFTIKSQSQDFFAVTTSRFKWSADGKWIAFIAVPTASLSADGNTLCLLSADAGTFLKAGQMLNYDEWFQWGPQGSTLAFIEGYGREATSNKRLTVLTGMPSLLQKSYTPAGYADRDLAWLDHDTLVAARSKEAAWSGEPSERPLPSLVLVNLGGGRQPELTRPPRNVGDFFPVLLKDAGCLAWIRTDRSKAHVMLAQPDGKRAVQWIRDLTVPDGYYEHWSWGEVIDFPR